MAQCNIQKLVDSGISLQIVMDYAEDSSNNEPSVADYENLGITGVDSENLATINAKISGVSKNDADTVEEIQEMGLDALIITGANVTQPHLPDEPFWQPLSEIFHWAHENVTSTLCSCLATHASLELHYKQPRYHLHHKRWGVFCHRVTDRSHPLVHGINTRFDVPHSRFNQIDRSQFEAAGLLILAESKEAGVQMAVSPDGFRTVYFQGHPEYDSISLLKEYKREVGLFSLAYNRGEKAEYPPFPAHYFNLRTQAIFDEYQYRLIKAIDEKKEPPIFPETLVLEHIDNSWHDTGAAIMANWMGLIYQVTNMNPKIPFMDDIDPDDPLGLKRKNK